jgi:hypothetical protein
MNEQTVKEYAVYKGDSFICLGTLEECADYTGMKPYTIWYYTTPSYQKKLNKRKNTSKSMIVIKLDDEDEEC